MPQGRVVQQFKHHLILEAQVGGVPRKFQVARSSCTEQADGALCCKEGTEIEHLFETQSPNTSKKLETVFIPDAVLRSISA